MNNFSGKTVLITGATGLIGSNLVDKFMSMEDVKVIALARSKEKLTKGFAEYIENKNFDVIVQDICSPLKLPDSVQVDYIFHAAGAMTGEVINNRPLEVIDANLTGTRNCLDLLIEQKKNGRGGRLVLFSSVTVYGNVSNTDITVTEEDTNLAGALDIPYAAYAETKRMSEVLALAYHRQNNVDVVIARLSTVYGYTRFPPNTAFYEFIKKALNNENIVLKSSGLPRRDNIYIDDAVNGLLLVCAKGISGEAYNISSNGELGNFAAVDEIAEAISITANEMFTKRTIVERNIAIIEQRKAGLLLDNTKAHALGFKINVRLTEGIGKIVSAFSNVQKRQGDGYNCTG